jgi:hypothetical protein
MFAEESGQLLLVNRTTKSIVQGSHRTIQNEEHHEKSRCIESLNGELNHERSCREKSSHEGSRHERPHREKSHQERRHQEKSHHGESHNNHRDEEVEDLKRKYDFIARQIAGEDLKSTAWEMLDDENLPFSERVRAYTMPDKFKMPWVEKYNRSGDLKVHLEAFREHLILHGTLDKIACIAFLLNLTKVVKLINLSCSWAQVRMSFTLFSSFFVSCGSLEAFAAGAQVSQGTLRPLVASVGWNSH